MFHQRVIFPPLLIKSGLMENFVKALNKEGQRFNLSHVFPKLGETKLKEGIFLRPHIRKLVII